MARSAISRDLLAALPRVTLGVLMASLLLQLGTSLGFRGQLGLADDELRGAVAFFVKHPMLAIPARLLPVLEDVMPGYEGNAAFDFLKRRNDPGLQSELDADVTRGLAALDSHPERVLGSVPAKRRAPSWLLHPLIHMGLLHWLCAALPFALAGAAVERLWGWRALAAFLPAVSVFSALVYGAFDSGLDRPLLGLGSWTAALAAALALRGRAQRVDHLAWLGPAASLQWLAPAWALVPVAMGAELLAWLVLPAELPASLRAHPAFGTRLLCGALGALAALALERSGIEARLGGTALGAEARPARGRSGASSGSRSALEQARAARAAGQLDEAAQLLAAEARRTPGHRELVNELWEVACQLSQPSLAWSAMQALVTSELRRGAVDAAVAHWSRMIQVDRRPVLDVETLLQLVPRIRHRCGQDEFELALEQLLRHPKVRSDADLLLRVAPLLAEHSATLAAEAVETLRERPELSETQQHGLEALARRLGLAGSEAGSLASPAAASTPDAFFSEQDRSAFGSLNEGGELSDESALREDGTLAEPRLFPGVSAREALPLELRDDGLVVEIAGRGRRKLAFERIRGVAFAGVRGLSPRPVLLVDLLLGDPKPGDQPLELLRLRSDAFNPLRLAPEAGGALEALRSFVASVARRAGVQPVPPALEGRPETYPSLADYQRRVLHAESGPAVDGEPERS